MTILNFNTHKPAIELSNAQLIQKASSIGATAPACHVSDKYSFIPTIDAVNFLRDAGWTPIEAKQGAPRLFEKMNFQRHAITFTKPELDLGDRRLQMTLYNSHDSGSSYTLSGGVYRLVCSNGMVVGSNQAEYRHRHMGFDANLFIESAKFVAEKMNTIAENLQEWETIELSPNEQGIFANAAHEIMFEGKHPNIQPEQLLTARRTADEGDDLWTTFNRIQENVTKGGLPGRSERGRRSRTRGITSIHRDKTMNQSLWSMADYMADVKKAA